MKLRYFLRGLGAGIVFAVLVLGISGGDSEKEALTDNEIIARARELGMVTKDEKLDESLSQIMDNQMEEEEKEKEETDQKDEQAGADSTEQNEEEKDKDTSGEEPKNEESKSEDTGKKTILPEPLEEEKTEVSFKVTISPGMSSKQVSAAFKKLGIIDNAEEFDDYLCDNGYSSEIKVGTYTIKGKPDYSEIARIITTKE